MHGTTDNKRPPDQAHSAEAATNADASTDAPGRRETPIGHVRPTEGRRSGGRGQSQEAAGAPSAGAAGRPQAAENVVALAGGVHAAGECQARGLHGSRPACPGEATIQLVFVREMSLLA